jgi:hypothetical protein
MDETSRAAEVDAVVELVDSVETFRLREEVPNDPKAEQADESAYRCLDATRSWQ